MTELPSLWKKPPKKESATPSPEPLQALAGSRHSTGGLIWPEDGFPAYYCIVSEKPVDTTNTFDTPVIPLEILSEGAANTLPELFETLKTLDKLRAFTWNVMMEQDKYQYIKEFSVLKRSSNTNYRLRAIRAFNFEASLLQIKDCIAHKRLIFPTDSLIKRQLSMFSKVDLKNETHFYAVRALALVLRAGKQRSGEVGATQVPDIRAWY